MKIPIAASRVTAFVSFLTETDGVSITLVGIFNVRRKSAQYKFEVAKGWGITPSEQIKEEKVRRLLFYPILSSISFATDSISANIRSIS